jgi:hypothetical protein
MRENSRNIIWNIIPVCVWGTEEKQVEPEVRTVLSRLKIEPGTCRLQATSFAWAVLQVQFFAVLVNCWCATLLSLHK